MLKRGIGLGLLCISGHTFSANVIVTTVDDVVKADEQCSLREAIQYVNMGMPAEGYNGCGGKESSAIIQLDSNKTYLLNSQVNITKSVEIKTIYTANVTESPVLGKQNAIIKAAGKDRLFTLDRTLDPAAAADQLMLKATFTEITLNGCGQSVCADQGGLIYSKEALVLSYVQLLKGYARQGGAIYNASTYVKDKALSSVGATNSLIQDNHAEQGAAIYSVTPTISVSQSVIRDNEVSNSASSIFESTDQFDEEIIKGLDTSIPFGIENTTIFNNKGYVVKVFDAMKVNNVTMILNSMGLIVDAPQKKGYVANSIIAQNGSQDCTFNSAVDDTQISNNLYGSGCTGLKSLALGNTQLIAGATTEGKCDFSTGGILCPFAEKATLSLGYFLPRLLPSYNAITDSPIVNHGPDIQDKVLFCSGVDQRGKARDLNSDLCDRGAIELLIDTSSATTVGQDILYDELAKFNIADQLQDGELVRPEQCKTIFKRETDENGQPWKIGCLKITQTNTPSKGTMTIDQNGEIVYTPNGHWQGSDEFKINVVTSTVSFNKSDNPYISIPGRVVQRKPNDFKDDKVKVSGGSLGWISVVGLIGLMGYRRKKYK